MASAIAKIESFLSAKSRNDFSTDAMLHDAVVRNLEILSEASRHVADALKAHAPEVPWRNVADIGNWLRHGYDVVSDQILWDTIQRDLPVLRNAVHRLIELSGKT
jgi:uncharacterized protein with HEPN domain